VRGCAISQGIHEPQPVLASCSDDTFVKLWNLQGECTATLRQHTDEVLSLVFSPDDKLLLSCGFDDTIRVWDYAAGEQVPCCSTAPTLPVWP